MIALEMDISSHLGLIVQSVLTDRYEMVDWAVFSLRQVTGPWQWSRDHGSGEEWTETEAGRGRFGCTASLLSDGVIPHWRSQETIALQASATQRHSGSRWP